ncbi:MATE family efflux transporter [candidate division KSB1 bacterium]|nr:MATE family efflux transporter [candidate division KSB1 bacterium]
MGMVVTLVYNIADTYFVGQTGDPMQVAAISLTIPVFLLFMAAGNMIGIGGASVISRTLGEQKVAKAKRVSSFCFYSSILVGILFLVLYWVMMPVLLTLIGTSTETIGYAKEYLNIIAPSAPFVIMSIAFSSIIRAEGKSKTAMFGMIIGTFINILLDPIMILGMNMGVGGAAVATLIGNMAGCTYFIVYIWRGNTSLSISPALFTLQDNIMSDILAIGIPVALNNALMSCSNVILNNFLSAYGDYQIAAMGIAMKIGMIVVLLQIGLGTGIQPLLGYSFGSKEKKRFISIMKVSIAYALLLGTILTLICYLCAGSIVKSFIDSAEVYKYAVKYVNILLLTGPVIGILFVFTSSLQAIGAAKESLIISLSRQGLVFLPVLIILNLTLKQFGLVLAQPIADFFTLFLSYILYSKITQKTWLIWDTDTVVAR